MAKVAAASQFTFSGLHQILTCHHRSKRRQKHGPAPCAPCARSAVENLHLALAALSPTYNATVAEDNAKGTRLKRAKDEHERRVAKRLVAL